MKAALAILRMQVVAKLQFRAAVWAQIVTMVFAAFVHSLIILIFFRFGQTGGAGTGMTSSQAVSYVWLVHIFLHLLPGMGLDPQIKERIRSGDVSLELCRPLDLYFHWFIQGVAQRIGPFLIHMAPIAVVALFLPAPYRLQPPASIWGFVACITSLALGVLLSAATMGLTYIILMKVSWGDGPVYVLAGVTDLLTGANLPLQLWPASWQRFLYLQPFAGIMDIPLRLYLGTLNPNSFPKVAALQLLWIGGLVSLGWLLMQRSLRKLVVQGG